MARRELTMRVIEEIRRRLEVGRPVREIARALKCSRDTVRRIRDGESVVSRGPRAPYRPWLDQVDWASVVEEFKLGHPLKFIWEERVHEVTTYSNFWKAFYQRYPDLKSAVVTPREFAPGERCEVDYAGGKVPWVNLKTGQVYEVPVFVSVLGFSQLLFATAKEDMKSRNFLECHREMYEAFQGVPQVTVTCWLSSVHRLLGHGFVRALC
jgi:transposase